MQKPLVERELNAAREREDRENRTVFFPVRIDNAVMDPNSLLLAADVRRSRHIGDFTRWKKHDAYARALELLLRDPKASQEGRRSPGVLTRGATFEEDAR